MASKYLNLEAAAQHLSLSVEELNRRRKQGEIRGFADRGTWKFRIGDIEELARTLDPDSSLDFGIMSEDGPLGNIPSVFDDDSKINLDEDLSDQPTIISKKPAGTPPSSDSDVRLVIDPAMEFDMVPPVVKQGKDSDVRFVDDALADVEPTPIRLGKEEAQSDISDDDLSGISGSDVRLASSESNIIGGDSENTISVGLPFDDDLSGISDSDVRLSPAESNIIGRDPAEATTVIPPSDEEDSDSDVTLLGVSGDENLSDLRLDDFENTDSDITLMPPGDDSVVRLEEMDDDEQSVLSDVVTDPAGGLSFSSGDSGISLDLSIDSGLLFDADDDDSITLASESGISLVPDSDVGLTLEDPMAGSDDDAGGATISMLSMSDEEDDENDTAFDMPLLEDSGEVVGDDDDTTNIVMFDDDESDDQTMEFDSSEISTEDDFVDFDDEDSFDELSDGELGVTDDLLDDDILEADDDAFDDDFESGESVPALSIPGGVRGGVAVAAEWDMISFGLVLLSTGFMGICTLLMFDLVRSMWGYETPISVNGMILDTLQGIIKS